MGLFDSIAKVVNPAASLSKTLFKGVTGESGASAVLSGIPFLGEGFAQEDQQQFSAQQASQQMQFQKYMSNTAHQRQVKDLKKAGLNPILSAPQTGASTPVGASGSSSALSGGKASAAIIKDIMNLTQDKARTEIDLGKEQKKLTEAQQIVAGNTAAKLLSDTKKANAEAARAKAEAQFIKNKDKQEAVRGDFYQKYGDKLMMLDTVHKGASTAGQFMRMAPAGIIQGLIEGGIKGAGGMKGQTKIKYPKIDPTEKPPIGHKRNYKIKGFKERHDKLKQRNK
jgi:hypothetical protein